MTIHEGRFISFGVEKIFIPVRNDTVISSYNTLTTKISFFKYTEIEVVDETGAVIIQGIAARSGFPHWLSKIWI